MKSLVTIITTIVLCAMSFGQYSGNGRSTSGSGSIVIASIKTSPSGPSVTMTCIPSNIGAPTNSCNFYRSTTSGSGYGLVGNSATFTFIDTTVTFSTTYYYVATAVNSSTCPTGQTCESGYSPQAMAVVGQNPVPNPPTGLTVTNIIAGKVPLKWNAPVPQSGIKVLSYSLWRCALPTCPSPPKIATVFNTTYTDHTGPGTHYYEVKANDVVGSNLVVTKPSNIVKAVVK